MLDDAGLLYTTRSSVAVSKLLQLLIPVVEAGFLSSVFFLLTSFVDFFLLLSLVFCCGLLAVEVVHSRDDVEWTNSRC